MALSPEVEARLGREHFEKYQAIVDRIGVENLRPIVPATAEVLAAALASGDEHLNTIPLKLWDRAVGYEQWPGLGRKKATCPTCKHQTLEVEPVVPVFFRRMSSAEAVCTLKHVATYYIAKGA